MSQYSSSVPTHSGDRRLVPWIGIILLWVSVSLAHARPPDPVFARLTHDQGLSDGTVEAIVEDHRGFLWFGTQDGLNRYDGYDFTVYRNDPEDPSSLPNNFVWELIEDSSGVLWVGTIDGLARYDRHRDAFVNYRHDGNDPTTVSHETVHTLLEDRAGRLWAGTFQGLDRFDPESETFVRYSPRESDPSRHLSVSNIRVILEDQGGDLWIGSQGGGLVRFDPDTGEKAYYVHDRDDPKSLSHNDIRALHEDHEGTLWIGSHGGLNRFNPKSETFTRWQHDVDDPQSLGSNYLDAVLEDAQGRLWIGTDGGGLNRFDQATGAFFRYPHDPYYPYSPPSNAVRTLFEDQKGDLWVGTYRGGVGIYSANNPPFIHRRRQFENPNSLSHNAVLSFFEEEDGILWIGTEGGLNRFTQGSHPGIEGFERFLHDPKDPTSLSANAVLCVLRDRRGRLWVGTFFGGLNRLERDGTFSHFPGDPDDPSGLTSPHVWDIFEDRSGDLWFATFGGLHRFEEATQTFVAYKNDPDDPKSLVADVSTLIYEDREGWLWVATYGGLSALDPSRQHFVNYHSDDIVPTALNNDQVISIHEDAQGRIWIGTQGGGLNLLERESRTFRAIRQTEGLGSDFIFCTAEDSSGHLWLSTQAGLSRLDTATLEIKNYDKSDNVLAMPFSSQACLAGRDGRLHFGGSQGFVSFDPDQIQEVTVTPSVVLTGFEIFNKKAVIGGEELTHHITEAQEIRLRHDQSVFSLRYAALDYRAPDKNQYAFRLDPFDKDWRMVGNERLATYTNLDPGEYVFRVKGSNSRGQWNEEGASIQISIAPPFWQTNGFRALVALALVAAALGYFHAHRRELDRERQSVERERQTAERERQTAERERAVNSRLREIDRLKDEFLANTSHELRTPLYGITGIVESLIEGTTGELPQETRDNLSMVAASGRRLSHLVNDILDFSKLRHRSLELHRRPVDLRTVVDVVLTLSAPLVGGKDLRLENVVPPDLPPADADENRLQQILYNLIGNAIKFTEAGVVQVSASLFGTGSNSGPRGGGGLLIRIRDTGIGIPAAQQEEIFTAFEQADASIEREFGGTGLGLAVTRRLVELHGGSIRVESSPGQGSTFLFDLPTASAETAPPPQSTPSTLLSPLLPPASLPAPSKVPATPQGDTARILAVDDEPINLQVLHNYLADEPFTLVTTTSGAEALDLLEQQPFDLVLLDVMMPRLSGFEVCRILRETHPVEQLPVLFLTAKNQSADVVAGLSLGANDFLTKPIEKEELLARLRPHLKLLEIHHHLEDLVEEQMSQVKVLEGLLPICSSCKRIRDEEDRWTQMETYIDQRSEASFSHSVCPDCAEAYFKGKGLT